MLHGHSVIPHAKRSITALLVMGSMMGFVMGQQLGHSSGEHIAHTTPPPSGVVAHAAANLGSAPVIAPQSAIVHASAPAAQPEQHKKHHGKGDSGHGGSGSQGDSHSD